MTTNHPARGPASLDRLHQIREILSKAAAQSDGGNLGYAMADAVKVIDGAIAAFGAEPVAWTTGRYSQNIGCNFGEKVPDEAPCIMSIYWDLDTFRAHTDCDATALRWLEEAIKNTGAKPLYTAPPAPVSVPAAMEMDDDFDSAFEHGKAVGWNACRTAMLQSFANTEQLDEIGSWNNHMNTPTAQAGNSPVTPDGWVACSERMPEDDTLCIAIDDIGVVWTAHYDDGVMAPDIPGSLMPEFTHWMPLPAAPQQDGL